MIRNEEIKKDRHAARGDMPCTCLLSGGCLRAAAAMLALAGVLAFTGGCGAKQEYAQASADIADSFPLYAEDAGENPQEAASDGPWAVLHTTAGDITVLLYPEQAPRTVENFIRLAQEHYYDGTEFFYVKKDELAQGGKPVSGEENSAYGEPFEDEFDDGLHNFPGAVGMAGNGIDNNLSQFYFVVADEPPEDVRIVTASFYFNELTRAGTEELNARGALATLSDAQVQEFEDALNAKIQSINTDGIPEEYLKHYEAAAKKYMTLGGKWGLDYKQTVFGQIVKGLNVARAITQVKVNAGDRSPKEPVVVESVEILESLEEADSPGTEAKP